MMSLAEERINERAHAGWDAAMAVLLGIVLLAAGWLDVRAFLAHRNRPQPQFAFMDPPGGERMGEAEVYRWNDDFVMLDNISGPEADLTLGRFRQALGPVGTLLISAHQAHALLEIRLYNPLAGQDITVNLNNQPVEQLAQLPEGVIARKYPLALRPGLNSVTFTFARYNHAGAVINDADSRLLAGTFLKLGLTLY